MNITSFSLFRSYEIKCKQFIPKDGIVKHVIVGVHGFAGDKESSMLLQLASSCADKQTALLCFDFPAHGESPAVENMLTVENCKQDLITAARHAQTKFSGAEMILFATSFGGYIALHCRDALSNFRFVLRAPAITMPDILLNNVLRISAASFQNAGSMECGFERRIQLPYSFYEDLLSQPDLINSEHTKPMLIVHGELDDIVAPSVVTEFACRNSNIQLKVIPGADHRFKNPGEIAQIIALTMEYLTL